MDNNEYSKFFAIKRKCQQFWRKFKKNKKKLKKQLTFKSIYDIIANVEGV